MLAVPDPMIYIGLKHPADTVDASESEGTT